MTLDAQTLALAARYERLILQAQSPCEVVALRRDLGMAIELLRSVGQTALRQEQVLRGGCDWPEYRQALRTASDPTAVWPPKTVKARIPNKEQR